MKTLMLIAGMFSISMIPTLAAGKPHVVFVTGGEEYQPEDNADAGLGAAFKQGLNPAFLPK